MVAPGDATSSSVRYNWYSFESVDVHVNMYSSCKCISVSVCLAVYMQLTVLLLFAVIFSAHFLLLVLFYSPTFALFVSIQHLNN